MIEKISQRNQKAMTKKHMNKPIKPQKPSSKSLPPLEMIEVSYVIGIDNNREPILFNKRTHPHYYNNEELSLIHI